MQIKVDKRFTNGVLFRVFYTRSKLINDGAENGQNGGGSFAQNPSNTQALERAVSADDVPNTFVASWSYELPFGKNRKHDVLYKFISGWTLNGVLRYESGRPLAVTMANDMGGLLFNGGKRPNLVLGSQAVTPAGRERQLRSEQGPLPESFRVVGSRSPTVRKCSAARSARARFSECGGRREHLQGHAIRGTCPMASRIAGRQRDESRGLLRSKSELERRASFGQVSLQCNQPRSVQLGTKLEF